MSAGAAGRPQTAPQQPATQRKRPLTAQQVRPLGRVVAQPVQLLRQQVASHGSNPAAVIGSLKADLLALQRRIDGYRSTDRGSTEMEFLERHLVALVPSPADELATSQTITTLLEMLVQRFHVLASAAMAHVASATNDDVLRKSHATSTVATDRISGVLSLTDYVDKVVARTQLWQAEAEAADPQGTSTSGGGGGSPGTTRTPSLHAALSMDGTSPGRVDTAASPDGTQRTALDDALNEPTTSQLRMLIRDQRALQQQLLQALDNNQSLATKSKEDAAKAAAEAAATKLAADAALADMTAQRDDLQQRLSTLRAEAAAVSQRSPLPTPSLGSGTKRGTVADGGDTSLGNTIRSPMASAGNQSLTAPDPTSVMHPFVRTVAQLAFAGVDPEVLHAAGYDASKLAIPPSLDADSLAGRIASLCSETNLPTLETPSRGGAAGGGGKKKGGGGGARSDEPTSPPPMSAEGVLWFMLATQSEALRCVEQYAQKTTVECTEQKERDTAEIQRLNRVLEAMNARVAAIKQGAVREAEALRGSRNPGSNPSAHKLDTLSVASADCGGVKTQAPKQRLLRTNLDALSASQREEELFREVAAQHKTIADLRSALAEKEHQLADEQQRASAAVRENARLLQDRQTGASRQGQVTTAMQKLEHEIQTLRQTHHATKKELRERTASEAELQQDLWKLKVELHIAQNVVADLRRRGEQLETSRVEATECHRVLNQSVAQIRDDHAKEVAKLQAQLHAVKTEQEVAAQVLRGERARTLENEKEVDRLRDLDDKMGVLEQNFTNYAAYKLAQREATEDEERILQECVDIIGRDVFVLPGNADTEERVQLHLRRLQSAREAFEADDRGRNNRKATSLNWRDDRSARKQLATTMQIRYNAVQIFACEQRLRQMELERDRRRLQIELDEGHKCQDGLNIELSHAKSQCDGLMQRNTEIELQRKEFNKYRVVAEQEIKSLKATIHKMRVAHEEQEKVLIEVGTRLQHQSSSGGGAAGGSRDLHPGRIIV